MENLTLGMVNRAEKELQGRIFTSRQLEVLRKRLQHLPLTVTEKTYYYKFIKPKIEAMRSLWNISSRIMSGREHMLSERIPPAMRILKHMELKHKHQKILLSGSFLFQKEFRDIDVFIFSKYQKEDYRWKNMHISFLPESALTSLFFSSLAQISIGNFTPEKARDFTFSVTDVLGTYELLVNEIMQKEDYQKTLRDFLLQVEYLSKKVILNSQQLYELRKKFTGKNTLKLLSRHFVDGFLLGFSAKELPFIRSEIEHYQKLQKEYKNSPNIQAYLETYHEVIALAS